ncbi:MAG: quinol:electron acceptor oxidoreductase subunit ActD [Pelovirga sp.]
MAKDIAVYGIYPNRMMVERAVEELTDAGFRHADISVLFPADENTKELTVEEESLVQERAATGGRTGAAIGSTLGLLAGIGTIAIPGIGPFIAAGPIMAALAGAGAGGLFGGVTGALIGAGIPEYEAKHYERRLKEGWILLSVHADDRVWKNKGKDILEQTGAEDIKAKAEPHVDH